MKRLKSRVQFSPGRAVDQLLRQKIVHQQQRCAAPPVRRNVPRQRVEGRLRRRGTPRRPSLRHDVDPAKAAQCHFGKRIPHSRGLHLMSCSAPIARQNTFSGLGPKLQVGKAKGA